MSIDNKDAEHLKLSCIATGYGKWYIYSEKCLTISYNQSYRMVQKTHSYVFTLKKEKLTLKQKPGHKYL